MSNLLNKIPCKYCEHPKNIHGIREPIVMGCMYTQDGMGICDCFAYVPDNLRYLESLVNKND